MRKQIDWFKSWTGKSIDEISHSFQNDFTSYFTCMTNSQYEPILLGRDPMSGSPFYVSLEQLLYHFEFLAPTRLGKSRALLHVLQNFILRGMRGAFFDPSKGGDTGYRLLGFCQENNVNVLFIDLNRRSNPVINPFHRMDKYGSITYLDDAFRVIFSVGDAATQANISRYLPSVLHVLWNTKLTLAEAVYFTDKIYEDQREYIFEKCREAEKQFNYSPVDRNKLESAFFNPRMYERFISTASRLDQLNHPAILALFGDKSSVQLKEVMKDCVIIVNLDIHGLSQLQKRVVGTILINEILYNKRSETPFFLFIDEAGQYATHKVAEVLDLYGKTGLVIGLSHQSDSQFPDKKILGSVKTNTHIKFTFLEKQIAEIKLFGMDPIILKIPDVPDLYGTADYEYEDRDKILHKCSNRIPYDPRQNSASLKSRTPSDRYANHENHSAPRTDRGQDLWEDLPAGDEGFGDLGKEETD